MNFNKHLSLIFLALICCPHVNWAASDVLKVGELAKLVEVKLDIKQDKNNYVASIQVKNNSVVPLILNTDCFERVRWAILYRDQTNGHYKKKMSTTSISDEDIVNLLEKKLREKVGIFVLKPGSSFEHKLIIGSDILQIPKEKKLESVKVKAVLPELFVGPVINESLLVSIEYFKMIIETGFFDITDMVNSGVKQ